MTEPEIPPAKKLEVFRWHLWLLSCQIPSKYWGKPEEAQFYIARELTGKTAETTRWNEITGTLKTKCPDVWQQAIDNAKSTLGISD